jgi:polar amino acid transport system substrate-binding protein
MKPSTTVTLAAIIAIAMAWTTVHFAAPKTITTALSPTAVYDRVMQTGKIRCGYAHWEPSNIIDTGANTHTGVGHDLMEEIGKRLSLQIEWIQEVGWGTAVQDLVSGKYDAICTLMFPNSMRARYADFSLPAYFSKTMVFVRADDTRFDNNQDKLNDPTTTISYVDGTTPQKISQSLFPKAKVISYPELSPTSDTAMAVTAKKADFMIWDLYNGSMFIKHNPGSIKPLPLKLAYFASSFMLPADDRFKAMINHAMFEILEDGTFDKIIDRYGVRDYFSPAAKPYIN